jgi:flagellum-specific peptidoglycan hydrolase FlgJ
MRNLIIILMAIAIKSDAQTPDSVYQELLNQNIQHPKIVLAQAILETGWFSCNDCSLTDNNLFGLYDSRCKEYFYYDNWKESIGGYKRGIQYKYDPSKHKDYYEFLKDVGYASDPLYINKVKEIVKLIENKEHTYFCLK